MKGEPTNTSKKIDKVHLCAGGGCCPDAVFPGDGSVVLAEDGQQIAMSRDSVLQLVEEMKKRGYL